MANVNREPQRGRYVPQEIDLEQLMVDRNHPRFTLEEAEKLTGVSVRKIHILIDPRTRYLSPEKRPNSGTRDIYVLKPSEVHWLLVYELLSQSGYEVREIVELKELFAFQNSLFPQMRATLVESFAGVPPENIENALASLVETAMNAYFSPRQRRETARQTKGLAMIQEYFISSGHNTFE